MNGEDDREEQEYILSNASGVISAGSSACLMGPANSGARTLLNTLSMRNRNKCEIEGEYAIGGAEPTVGFTRRNCGFVETSEPLVGYLTVRELLLYKERLKNASRPRSRRRSQRRVDSLIGSLGLSTSANVHVGAKRRRNISPQKAKLTAIASQLVSSPGVLFLDQPGAYLDVFTALQMLHTVKSYCSSLNITVVASVHPPSSQLLSLFDRLLVFLNGKQAFFGPVHCNAHRCLVFDFFRRNSLTQTQFEWDDQLAGFLTDLLAQSLRDGTHQSLTDAWSLSHLKSETDSLVESILQRHRDLESQGKRISRQRPSIWSHHKHSSQLNGARAREPAGTVDKGDGPMNAESNEMLERLNERIEDYDDAEKESVAYRLHEGRSINPFHVTLPTLLAFTTTRKHMNIGFIASRTLDKALQAFILFSLLWQDGGEYAPSKLGVLSAVLYIVVIVSSFGGAVYVAPIAHDCSLFRREISDGLYTSWVFLVKKIADELPLILLVSISYTSSIFWAINFVGNFGFFVLIYFVHSNVILVFVFSIALIAPNVTVASTALPAIMQALVLCAGFLLNLSDQPPYWRYWLAYADFLHYTWGALMINEFGHDMAGGYRPVKPSGVGLLESYDLDRSKWMFALWLFLFWVGFLAIALFAAYVRTIDL